MGGGRNTGNGTTGDGVSTYPADDARLATYVVASGELATFHAPVLLPQDDPHARLFVAAFDGTGNDSLKNPSHATNVANLHDQTVLASNRDGHLSTGYMAGPGTQSGFLTSTLDSATGRTYDQRLEGMYKQFIDQAYLWKQEDPQAKISVADIGFSRGAEQAAGFARMVHERGIQDPTGATYSYNKDGLITKVSYSKDKEPLVPPGRVPQVEGLFDAVGTGEPHKHDRRPPPSVISGVHIIAEDERRGKFKVDYIIPPGKTDEGRFLGLTVAGAHSDIGGSYQLDGLSTRSNNLMVDYLNSLRDQPFLEKRAEPTEQRLNVVHRSEEGNVLFKYGSKVDRLDNGYINQPAPEPRDPALSDSFRWRQVTIGPVPQQEAQHEQQGRAAPSNELSARVERMREAMNTNNSSALHQDMHALASSSSAQTQSQQARAAVDQQPIAATTQRQGQGQQPPAQNTDQQQSPQQQPNNPQRARL